MESKELRIDNLTNGFQNGSKHTVLQKGISASLQSGELICLLGSNGVGKSTLMRTLSGFQRSLSGTVLFSGHDLDTMSLKNRAKEVAVVFTGQINDPYLTAFEVVSMGRFPYVSFYGKLNKRDVDFVEQTMKSLHIYHLKDQIFQQLSDGEKQKMLLARALVQDTPFLFLDEPVSFVDSPGKIEIMEWLSHFAHEQKKGILITTHDIELALDYADKLWLLSRDRPFQSGIPEDLVLKGMINQYFDRDFINFDPEKGRFGKRINSDKELIYLEGDQLEIQWLCRAFTRMGKEVRKVSSKNAANNYYSFDGKQYVFSEDKKEDLFFRNIEEILFRYNK